MIKELASLGSGERAVIGRALADLTSLDAAVRAIPSGSLFGPIDHLRTSAQQAQQRLDGPVRAGLTILQALPSIVGTGTHRYLLLLTNPGEERGGGGFIGAVGTVVFQDGQLLSSNFMASDFSDALVTDIPAPAPIAAITGTNLVLADSYWSPNFPTSAALAAEFYTRATGLAGRRRDQRRPDRALVRPPRRRQRAGAAVPAGRQREQFAPRAQLHHQHGAPRRPRQGLPGALRARRGRRCFQDAREANGWRSRRRSSAALPRSTSCSTSTMRSSSGWSSTPGSAACFPRSRPAMPLLVADSNLSGTKGDLFVTRHYDLRATVDAHGHVQDRLTLTYHNPAGDRAGQCRAAEQHRRPV